MEGHFAGRQTIAQHWRNTSTQAGFLAAALFCTVNGGFVGFYRDISKRALEGGTSSITASLCVHSDNGISIALLHIISWTGDRTARNVTASPNIMSSQCARLVFEQEISGAGEITARNITTSSFIVPTNLVCILHKHFGARTGELATSRGAADLISTSCHGRRRGNWKQAAGTLMLCASSVAANFCGISECGCWIGHWQVVTGALDTRANRGATNCSLISTCGGCISHLLEMGGTLELTASQLTARSIISRCRSGISDLHIMPSALVSTAKGFAASGIVVSTDFVCIGFQAVVRPTSKVAARGRAAK